MLNHNQNLFLIVFYCSCSFGEFAKVYERQVWHVRVAHLHIAARALSSPSQCFQIVNKSWQRFVSLSFVLICYSNFNQCQKATKIMCVSFTYNKTLHCETKIGKEFWYNVTQARFIRRTSTVSNSIQLSVAEMRQLIHTSNFCRI